MTSSVSPLPEGRADGRVVESDFLRGFRLALSQMQEWIDRHPFAAPVVAVPEAGEREECCQDHNRLEEPGEQPVVCSSRSYCCNGCPTVAGQWADPELERQVKAAKRPDTTCMCGRPIEEHLPLGQCPPAVPVGVQPEPAEERPEDRLWATCELKEAAGRLGFELREEFAWDDRTETGSWRFIVWDTTYESWADV